jgi:hypothetical protein
MIIGQTVVAGHPTRHLGSTGGPGGFEQLQLMFSDLLPVFLLTETAQEYGFLGAHSSTQSFHSSALQGCHCQSL